jgi:hypothetical protein
LSIAALSGPTASQNPLLFQIDGDVESVSAIAHLLPSASPDSLFGLNHSYLSNAAENSCCQMVPEEITELH